MALSRVGLFRPTTGSMTLCPVTAGSGGIGGLTGHIEPDFGPQ